MNCYNIFSSNDKPDCLYLLPKLHKIGNLRTPIKSFNGTATENPSAFIDFHLSLTSRQPLLKTKQIQLIFFHFIFLSKFVESRDYPS